MATARTGVRKVLPLRSRIALRMIRPTATPMPMKMNVQGSPPWKTPLATAAMTLACGAGSGLAAGAAWPAKP